MSMCRAPASTVIVSAPILQDPVHLHPDQRAAVGGAAGRRGMVGADRAHRRGVFRGILQYGDDVVHGVGVDDDAGMRDHVAEPVGDFEIGHGSSPPCRDAVRPALVFRKPYTNSSPPSQRLFTKFSTGVYAPLGPGRLWLALELPHPQPVSSIIMTRMEIAPCVVAAIMAPALGRVKGRLSVYELAPLKNRRRHLPAGNIASTAAPAICRMNRDR